MHHYPEELRNQPLPVVLFLSSDTVNVEKVIQHMTTRSVPGSKQEQTIFRILNEKWGTSPSTPAQRTLASDRKPKANWMRKYFYTFAASVVFFIEWPERNERTLETWKTKTEKEVSTVLDAVVQSTKWSKGLKINIVLLQTDNNALRTFLPFFFNFAASDSSHDERVATLSKFVDSKSIIYFSMLDMVNSTKKLEKIIQKSAVEYYTSEASFLKRQLDNVNRQTQLKLLIRRHFQIGYLNEFAEKKGKSLKHYTLAYNYIKEIKKTRTEIDEMKVMADFINYKLCRIYMDSAQVADAINQFHKHITYYKTFVQEPDVEFQHWAWIGNQFEAFGSLMVIYQAAQIQLQQIQQQNQPASPQVTSSPVPPAQQNLPTSPQNMSQSSLPHGYWHPGFYYQSASSYQILRRKSFERIFQQYKDDARLPEIRGRLTGNPSWTILFPEKQPYIGQQNYRLAFKDALPEEEISQWTMQQICVAQETLVNHCSITTSLLKQTLEQYGKESVNERTKLALQAELANELMTAQKFQEARGYLDFLSKEFEREQWWLLLSEVLNHMLTMATTTNSLLEEIKCSLKLLNPEIGIPEERRKTLQNRIYKILFTLPTAPTPASTIGPSSERGYSTTGRHSIRKSLDSGPTGSTPGQTSAGLFILGQMKEPLVVPLPYEHSLRTTSFFPLHPSTILLVCPIFSDEFLVSCKVEFVGEVGYSGVPIQGNFHITSMFPEKITLSSITLHFVDTGEIKGPKSSSLEPATSKSSIEFTTDPNPPPAGSDAPPQSGITLLPGQDKLIPFQIKRNVATMVECCTIDAVFGNTAIPSNPHIVIFRWDLTQWPKIVPQSQLRLGKKFVERTSIRVLEYDTKLNLDITHHPPLLIHEYYRVDVVLENPMKDAVTDASALFTPAEGFVFTMENGKRVPCSKLDFDTIPPLGSVQKTIYLLVQQVTDQKTLEVKIKYETAKYSTSISKKVVIPVQPPFLLLVEYFSKNFHVLTAAPHSGPGHAPPTVAAAGAPGLAPPAEPHAIKTQDKFLLQVETTGTTPFPIHFASVNLLVSDTVADFFGTSPSGGHELQNSQKYTHWFQFNAKQLGVSKPGYVVVTWMRSGPGSDGTLSKTSYQLPTIDVFSSEFSLNYEFGSSAMVGEAFPFSVKISNHTTLAQDFYVRVADTDNFLIAGEKKAQFTTNPGTTYCLDYVLFPLVPGRVGLPKFDVTALRNNMKLTKPTAAEQFVFVRPLLAQQMLI